MNKETKLQCLLNLVEIKEGNDFLEKFDNFYFSYKKKEWDKLLKWVNVKDSFELYDILVEM